MGYSPWDCKELDMTEHTYMYSLYNIYILFHIYVLMLGRFSRSRPMLSVLKIDTVKCLSKSCPIYTPRTGVLIW